MSARSDFSTLERRLCAAWHICGHPRPRLAPHSIARPVLVRAVRTAPPGRAAIGTVLQLSRTSGPRRRTPREHARHRRPAHDRSVRARARVRRAGAVVERVRPRGRAGVLGALEALGGASAAVAPIRRLEDVADVVATGRSAHDRQAGCAALRLVPRAGLAAGAGAGAAAVALSGRAARRGRAARHCTGRRGGERHDDERGQAGETLGGVNCHQRWIPSRIGFRSGRRARAHEGPAATRVAPDLICCNSADMHASTMCRAGTDSGSGARRAALGYARPRLLPVVMPPAMRCARRSGSGMLPCSVVSATSFRA